jgi:hypothetical protein
MGIIIGAAAMGVALVWLMIGVEVAITGTEVAMTGAALTIGVEVAMTGAALTIGAVAAMGAVIITGGSTMGGSITFLSCSDTLTNTDQHSVTDDCVDVTCVCTFSM